MMVGKINWYGDECAAKVEAAGWEGLAQAVTFFWRKCVEALNVSNPRPHKTPSRPGEPPRKRTGFGQKNVKYELDKKGMRGRVGVGANAKYMAFLDRGTKRCLPRPWLLATLEKFMGQIKSLAQAG